MFQFTEEQNMLRSAVAGFAKKNVAPLVEEAESSRQFPVGLLRKMGELGYLCAGFPVEYGGAGADLVSECIVFEELAKVCCGIAGSIVIQSGIGSTMILNHGSEEQKQKYIVPVVKGEKIGAFALTEPNAGSDAASILTRADKTENGGYRLNGTKMFITNGPICDYALVAARTGKGTTPADGISVFIVDKDTPGFTVSRKLEKVGFLSSETAELVFEDCAVEREQLIGEEGKGFHYLMGALTRGRITHSAASLGGARAALELSVDYAKERVQFGKPIAKFQAISFKLAEMAMKVEAAMLMTYRAASMFDRGEKCLKEASMAKLFASEAMVNVCSEGMRIFGGYGYMMEYPIQRFWRDSMMRVTTEGTSEIQHLVIAREMGL